MAELRGNVFQAFAVAEKEARERVPSVMQAPTTDSGFVACLPIDAIPPVVHVPRLTFRASDGLAIFPKDLAGA